MFLEHYVSFCEADTCAIYVEGGLAAVLVIALAIYICFDKVAEALIWNLYLKKFEIGCFALTMPDGTEYEFGDVDSDFRASIIVHDTKCFNRMVLQESIGMADAYMDGQWDTPDLARMVELIIENVKGKVVLGPPVLIQKFTTRVEGLGRWIHSNNPIQSLKNVQEHYDIGNEMYKLMLDPETMSYTCALWRDPALRGFRSFPDTPVHPDGGSPFGPSSPMEEMTLGEAQLNKIHYVIEKAGLTKDDMVAELGCGWGGFSIEAAATVGCRVRAYNLSKEQVAYATAKAERRGVSHLVEYVQQDYRTAGEDGQAGTYDKVVSIGMFEHVGDHYFGTFFEFVESLLKPGGTAVIHTITSADNEYSEYKLKTGFIQKYIFPGCCIPAVSAIIHAMGTQSSLELQHFDNIGEHYALTLRAWRENFYKNIAEIEKLPGSPMWPHYDERFQRMWDFYLCNCEAEFTTGHFGLAQFIFRAPSKDYRGAAIDELLPRVPSLYQAPGDRVAGPPPAKAVGKKKGKARSPSPKKKK